MRASTGVPPHGGDRRAVLGQIELAAHLETDRLVAGDVHRIGRLQIGGHVLAVDGGEVLRQQRHADARTSAVWMGAEEAQVEVRPLARVCGLEPSEHLHDQVATRPDQADQQRIEACRVRIGELRATGRNPEGGRFELRSGPHPAVAEAPLEEQAPQCIELVRAMLLVVEDPSPDWVMEEGPGQCVGDRSDVPHRDLTNVHDCIMVHGVLFFTPCPTDRPAGKRLDWSGRSGDYHGSPVSWSSPRRVFRTPWAGSILPRPGNCPDVRKSPTSSVQASGPLGVVAPHQATDPDESLDAEGEPDFSDAADSRDRNEPSSEIVLMREAGNTTVEFLSTAISMRVWRLRNWSANGWFIMMSEASPSDDAAIASPSAAMIFARFSRSASASLAIARFMSSGSWMSFSSTRVTSTPHSVAVSSRISRMSTLMRSVSARVSSSVCWPTTLRSVV